MLNKKKYYYIQLIVSLFFLSIFSLLYCTDRLEPKWDFEDLLIKPNYENTNNLKSNHGDKFNITFKNSYDFDKISSTFSISKTNIRLKSSAHYYNKIYQFESGLIYKNIELSFNKLLYENKPKLDNYHFKNAVSWNLFELYSNIDIWNDDYFMNMFGKYSNFGLGFQKFSKQYLLGTNYVFDADKHNYEIGIVYLEQFAPVLSYLYTSNSFYLLVLSDIKLKPFPFD
ncbi:MAG: hypothetical protein U9N34_10560, partial [Candidatus Cloacimonadota bacterium]|nr:hypothetical protein [Candidatus Cloacimonadota bacterium]